MAPSPKARAASPPPAGAAKPAPVKTTSAAPGWGEVAIALSVLVVLGLTRLYTGEELGLVKDYVFRSSVKGYDYLGSKGTGSNGSESSTGGTVWKKITPSEQLVYHACFDGFQCARLDVPMDWNATDEGGQRVAVAFAKLPARVPVTDPRYGGLILLNPGGPGGSGIKHVLNHGKTIQMIADSDQDPSSTAYDTSTATPLYFDVASFDPRGVNNTTPHFSCFPTGLSRQLWQMQSLSEGILGSSDDAFASVWARTNALTEGCTHRVLEGNTTEDQLAYHMNTTPVVADMVALIEAHGQWRDTEALGARTIFHTKHNALTERTRWRKGEEKLLYWGFSYGTVLGATFAAMQPQRIHRAVIDGVADAVDYYHSGWMANLDDTDLMLDAFSSNCFAAGTPDRCALYDPAGPDAIKADFLRIAHSLKGHPLGVPAHGAFAPDLITYTDVNWAIRSALYSPLRDFDTLAVLLADVRARNGSAFAAHKQEKQALDLPSSECVDAPPYAQECQVPGGVLDETTTAILCTDGDGTFGMSEAEFRSYWRYLQEQSGLIGDSWAHIRMACVGWGIQPKWRYGGPFGGDTAHPMLIVGTSRDPVTPIRNAHKMATRFPSAAVLELDADGHCTIAAPSVATAKAIRAYFQTGALPLPGTVLEDDERPFVGRTKGVFGDGRDEELFWALRGSAVRF